MNAQLAALWGLAIILAANFLNYLDRQLISALERPIRDALRLRPWEYGLLWTLFTVGYMLCAMPIGLLADRFRRTRLFAVCIIIWSLATVVSGLAETKLVLYAARVLIGVGEAGCLVIGPALLCDLFSREARGRVLSLFYVAMPLGGISAFLMAGWLYDFWPPEQGWRNMFYLAGAPGFLVAGLIWILPDPPRGATEGAHHGVHAASFRDYLQLLKTPTLLLIILAQTFAVILLVPLVHYGTEFLVDTHGLGVRQARFMLGLVMIGGTVGIAVSGFLGDWLARRMAGAYALLAGLSYLLAWPCLLIGFVGDQRSLFWALPLGGFFLFLCMPAVNTQIANVANPAQRATAWALAVFVLHLLGDTLAPPVFGVVIEQLGHGNEAVGRQQALVFFSVSLLLASICCFIAVFTARGDTARVLQAVAIDSELKSKRQLAGEDLSKDGENPAAEAIQPASPADIIGEPGT